MRNLIDSFYFYFSEWELKFFTFIFDLCPDNCITFFDFGATDMNKHRLLFQHLFKVKTCYRLFYLLSFFKEKEIKKENHYF